MVHACSSELLVWASPYYVGNLTRHNLTTIMDAQFYGDWWAQVLEWCPHLDLIVPQDSMGAQGNSFQVRTVPDIELHILLLVHHTRLLVSTRPSVRPSVLV